jgi:hypothetical protein
MALARQMRKEYALIVARGFVLQLDCPVYLPLEELLPHMLEDSEEFYRRIT